MSPVRYYPIFLDVTGRPVLLVGGGRVALEKLGKLLDAGADVTVVAPELIPGVRTFIDRGRARWIERSFAPGDTAGAFLVMVATDDGAVNRQVAEEARSNGALVNAADDAGNSDFILPSLAQRGRVTLAASTGGSSPAMARWLRTKMGEWLSDEVAALADLAADVRIVARERESACAARCTRTLPPPPLTCDACPNKVPAERWQEAMRDAATLELLRDGRMDEARDRMLDALGLRVPLAEAASWKRDGTPAPGESEL